MRHDLINKLVDLMTNPESEHRNGHESGECRVAGSTFDLGTFEVLVTYNGNEMHTSGHCGLQYLSIKQDEKNIIIRVLRRKGAFIKNDTVLDKGDHIGLKAWYDVWFSEVIAENKKPTPMNY